MVPESTRTAEPRAGADKLTTLLLAGILGLALALRLTTLHAGHPDEDPVVRVAMALKLRDLNPHAFFYGSFTFYLFKVVSVLWTTVYPGAAQWAPDATSWYLLFRVVSLLFGTATVFVAFLLGKTVANSRVGLLAAAMLAVSPLAVSLSGLATVDAICGFWAALAWLGIALWARRGPEWADYLAGAAIGAAIATKFNAVFMVLPIVLVAMQRNRTLIAQKPSRMHRIVLVGVVSMMVTVCVGAWVAQEYLLALAARWTRTGELLPSYVRLFDKILIAFTVAAAGGVVVVVGMHMRWRWSLWLAGTMTSRVLLRPLTMALLVFFCFSPYAILDPKTSVPDVLYQVNKTILGRVASLSHDARMQLERAGNLPSLDHFYYIRAIATEWGRPMFLFILIGAWLLIRDLREVRLPFAVTLALLLAMTMGWRFPAERYVYPMWCPLCLLGGLGLARISEHIYTLSSRRFSTLNRNHEQI